MKRTHILAALTVLAAMAALASSQHVSVRAPDPSRALSCARRSVSVIFQRFAAKLSDGAKVVFELFRVSQEAFDVMVTNSRTMATGLSFMQCAGGVNSREHAFSYDAAGVCRAHKLRGSFCCVADGDINVYVRKDFVQNDSDTAYVEQGNNLVGYIPSLLFTLEELNAEVLDDGSLSSLDDTKVIVHKDDKFYQFTNTRHIDILTCMAPNSCGMRAAITKTAAMSHVVVGNCGKTIQDPLNFGDRIVSHAGYGCVPFPDYVEDCSLTFTVVTSVDGFLWETSDFSRDGLCDGFEITLALSGETPRDLCALSEGTAYSIDANVPYVLRIKGTATTNRKLVGFTATLLED
ncbi:uncharacterized protein LOC108674000 [Hyalella azteca]|uniref:Uncharacterized protein LOC108674000 n=1 Tax=Hyalella azteca TaxID=294128 RepID=A0A8B7NUE7_HYAAZ|nr:uncharacterized protein LOC108674000 [Hyalella azteca]